MSISVAVAGVVAAGLGLATMSFALKPLPKTGVPVVIATSAPIRAAAYRHAPPRVIPPADAVDDEVIAVRPHVRIRHQEVLKKHADPAPAAEAAPKLIPAQAPAATAVSVAPAKPALQIAKADLPAEKLCKAPPSQVLSAKTLEPAMILRYDAKKIRPLDITPPPSASDDTERRLKLSALLANMLDR